MMQELKLLESEPKINWNEFFVSKSWACNATIEKFGNNGDITQKSSLWSTVSEKGTIQNSELLFKYFLESDILNGEFKQANLALDQEIRTQVQNSEFSENLKDIMEIMKDLILNM
jgi:hypothetical protein